MMAANYRHIGCLENRLGRHYSRFSASGPAAPLAAQSLARRKSPNHGSNRRSQVSIPNELSALMRLAEERRDQKETHRGARDNSGRGWHFRGRNIMFRYEAVGRGEDPL